jgi:hypothetical protein
VEKQKQNLGTGSQSQNYYVSAYELCPQGVYRPRGRHTRAQAIKCQ